MSERRAAAWSAERPEDRRPRRPGRRSGPATLSGVLLALALLAGCGGPAPRHTGSAAASSSSPATASSSASPADGPSMSQGDQRACAGAESLIGHLAAVTAHWSPTRKPFDPKIRQDIATFAGSLAAQRRFADTPPVRAAISANATSFTGMATAMTERNRKHVTHAIADVRLHYQRLKSLCSLSN